MIASLYHGCDALCFLMEACSLNRVDSCGVFSTVAISFLVSLRKNHLFIPHNGKWRQTAFPYDRTISETASITAPGSLMQGRPRWNLIAQRRIQPVRPSGREAESILFPDAERHPRA